MGLGYLFLKKLDIFWRITSSVTYFCMSIILGEIQNESGVGSSQGFLLCG
jgi:hypothetical protein